MRQALDDYVASIEDETRTSDPTPEKPVRAKGEGPVVFAKSWLRGARAGGVLTGDLVVLSVLVVLMAMFGRPFSKIGVPGTPLYVTEVAAASVFALALVRCGPSGAVARVRTTIPLVALGLFWLAGAIALARGLHWGFFRWKHDVGLVEYSVFLPLTALVIDSRARARGFIAVLQAAGIAAIVVATPVFLFASDSTIARLGIANSAVTVYVSLFVVLAVARFVSGLPLRPWELAMVASGTILMLPLHSRSAWVGLASAAVVLVALAPGRGPRRLLVGSGLAVLFCVGAAFEFTAGSAHTTSTLPYTQAMARPNFVADDGLTAFVGGSWVRDPLHGRYARRLPVYGTGTRDWLELTRLSGLEPGSIYTVEFALKPIRALQAVGAVGDTSGAGWGADSWRTSSERSWQRFRFHLTATKPVERLVLFDRSGTAVLVDDLRVVKGRVGGPSGNVSPDPISGQVPIRRENAQAPAASEPAIPGASDANSRWRLDYWRFLIRKSAHEPVLGAGFGRPDAFHWNGLVYDARTGSGSEFDFTPPHNSFVNIFHRMGLLGLLPLIWLMLVAMFRVVRAVRARESFATLQRSWG